MGVIINLILAYILNIIDYIFTLVWVKKYGIEIEANPIGRWMLENNIAWVFKIFVIGGLFALLGYLLHCYTKYAWVGYIPLVVYGFIVIYHIVILIKIS